MKKVLIGLILVMVVMIGCKPCSDLETKICTDLGEKCEKWKSMGKPGLPTEDQDQYRSGRRKLVGILLESVGLMERNAQACEGLSSNYDALIVPLKKSME
ncbi:MULTISPECIES: hypothetical protein [Leptospira]|nr:MULTISPECIES: hypothetical protein [Leptospira]EMO07615.1 putative lipoprotein [Leptospira borgpetersenii str. Noumea 25]EMO61766.1 putative lipoprotein [Leptospira borgpetersenii serovar Pomona str. 200901868]ALO27905.1 putative lipoprotein [Leptospira borgpetersenii serovar Ballum]ANH02103.1 Putative lipoprotein [Leptospira borgpetersenii str. 4E]AXX16841.1 hypothetical protein C4Q31_16195 [Leptospira borgpetersenii serovar Ceylonica]